MLVWAVIGDKILLASGISTSHFEKPAVRVQYLVLPEINKSWIVAAIVWIRITQCREGWGCLTMGGSRQSCLPLIFLVNSENSAAISRRVVGDSQEAENTSAIGLFAVDPGQSAATMESGPSSSGDSLSKLPNSWHRDELLMPSMSAMRCFNAVIVWGGAIESASIRPRTTPLDLTGCLGLSSPSSV